MLLPFCHVLPGSTLLTMHKKVKIQNKKISASDSWVTQTAASTWDVEFNLFAAFMCFQGRHITSPFWIQTTSCVKKCFVYNAVGTFTCRMKPSIQIGISNSCCLCQVQMEWKLLKTSSLCLPNNHRFSCLSADVYSCLEVTGSHLAPWYLYSIIL